MEVEKLTLAQERAEEIYQESREALKSHAGAQRSQFLKDVRSLTNQLRRKRKILDIQLTFKKAGLNQEGDPKLAITRGDQAWAYFEKLRGGAGVFHFNRARTNRWETLKKDIQLPKETFPEWSKNPQYPSWIKDQNRKTIKPGVPAKILNLIPKHHTLKTYHILWEAEKWEAVPKDPFLLKRITPVFYAVVGAWNLTKLERAVMRGRL